MLNQRDGFEAISRHDLGLKMTVLVFSECVVVKELLIFFVVKVWVIYSLPTKLNIEQLVPFYVFIAHLIGCFFDYSLCCAFNVLLNRM